MESISMDWIAIVLAAFLNMIINAVWYSKFLFGSNKKERMYGRGLSILAGSAISLIIAFFLAFFEGHLGITTVSDGMFVGFCIWLGFVATTQISSVIWKAESFRSFFIHTGCKLLSFLVMSGIIGA